MIPFTVTEKTALTKRISAFTLQPADGARPLGWAAGAHVDVDLGEVGARSYSLISWPGVDTNCYRIAVQREENGTGGSAAMHALSVGATVPISAPKNSFALEDTDDPVALIAGGIGITPLISMATELLQAGRLFVLHYAGRSAEVVAYEPELAQMLGDRLISHFDDTTPLDLPATLAILTDHRLYVCGPRGMIDATRIAAEAADIPGSRVHLELFASPDADGDDAAFEVEISSTGNVYTVPPNVSIIEALEAEGVDLMYDCQRGDCGICQVDVLDGTPDHRDVVLSDAEKQSGKVMQICVSRALSKRLVLDI
ncbi:PDR/VanB family oxidoreductase [Jannaschia sp. CCS1]|uniref:PDR/VanB family oxidoreductase n=1 Tax=Jannaschia sp. (strain CCS1) TaxID=290400 RepID=UPI0002FA6537|nr:PDR/VanB family oxidoreductase [Jannaschia sp. CCS1]